MDQEKIWTHITRKLTGENTEDDTNKIEEWLNEKPENKEIYSRLKEVWDFNPNSGDINYSLFESIRKRIRIHESLSKRNLFNSPLFKAAAILALMLVSNFMVYYFKKDSIKPELVSWQEIQVPRGNRMKLVLPDSTSIWLNNETKLRYASNFSGSNREVELSGEAYFEVHHDALHPFIVKVGAQKIKVLGTKFSVNAYPEDNFIETSLVSGSVVFESERKINGNSVFKLDPGYSLFYDKKKNSVSTSKIQSSYYQYWENGVYAFKDERFESLAFKIKRIFNVEVVFENEFLKNKTYTGTININDNIFLFMEAIRRTSVQPIEYRFNKNIIYVKLKTNKKTTL